MAKIDAGLKGGVGKILGQLDIVKGAFKAERFAGDVVIVFDGRYCT